MNKDDNDLIFESYIKEAVVPFKKRREVRKGMAKKHGKKVLKPYTFGFDIEFSVPLDEEYIRYMLGNYEFHAPPHQHDYIKWVGENVANDPEYEDINDWKIHNPEPDQDDYTANVDKLDSDEIDNEEKYDTAYNLDYEAWKSDYDEWDYRRDEVNKKISAFQNALENSDDAFKQYLIDSGQWKKWVNIDGGNIDYVIEEIERDLRDELMPYRDEMDEDTYSDDEGLMGWDVSEDEARNYEITSPILSTKDIPMVKDVLSIIGNYGEANGGTSAHIHIGIPDGFDFFDLIVLYDLVDEDKITQFQPNRNRDYTQLKSSFYREIYEKIRKIENFDDGDIIDVKDLHIGLEKHMGINISGVSSRIKEREKGKKFTGGAGKTVEFRYLSSEIFDRSNGIEEFLEWIEYFIMLMKVAQTRNQFKVPNINEKGGDKLVLTRVNKDQIRLNINKAKMPYEKPSELKSRESSNKPNAVFTKLNEKLYKMSTSDYFQQKHKKPDFKNMSKSDVKRWWLSTPEHAYQFLTNSVRYFGEPVRQEFLDRVQDSYKQTIDIFLSIDLKRRLPKLEHRLMYGKPKDKQERIDMRSAMEVYVNHLNRINEIDWKTNSGFSVIQKNNNFDDEQKMFRDIINTLGKAKNEI